ncbi:MAG: hypothetical protein QNL70_07815, partial [Pseudomonas sp.]
MPRLHLLPVLLFTCLSLLLPAANAQESDSEVSAIERLQTDIAALPDSGKSAAEQQQLQEAWEQTLT